jgi:hypothetical protein
MGRDAGPRSSLPILQGDVFAERFQERGRMTTDIVTRLRDLFARAEFYRQRRAEIARLVTIRNAKRARQ